MALMRSEGETSLLARAQDRLFGWRDRLVSNLWFQRRIAAFPLTRSLARRKQRATFDIVAGFVYSQTLQAAVRLKLPEAAASRPLTLDEIAARTGLAPDAARRLTLACVSLDILSRRAGGRYGLGETGAAICGNPGVLAMIEHHALFYEDLRDPVALLKGEAGETRLSRFWAYARSKDPAGLKPEDVEAYSRLMAASQSFIAEDILDAYPLRKRRRLLDLGGGEGAFVSAAAARAPHMEFAVFDLPAVAARAEARFAAERLSGRCRAIGGDLFTDDPPGGFDVVTLVRVLHDHDRAQAVAILRRARAAVTPGGVVLVAEPMAEAPGAETVGAAYFGFYLLAMTSGVARSQDDIAAMAREAGFASCRAVRTHSPLMTSLAALHP